MKKYDTLIFDLDGTLAVSKSPLHDEMADLLSKSTHHINVVVITGGMFEQIRKQVIVRLTPEAKLEHIYILPTSGAGMRQYNFENDEWEVIYDKKLTFEQKERIIAGLEDALEKASFTINPDILVGEQIEDRGSQITLSALGQKQLSEVKASWDPERTKRKELLGYLSHLEDEFNIKFGGGTSIDITLKGIDKAFGINQFYSHTNLSIENGLFVGDQIVPGGNDFAVTKTDIDTRDTTGPDETMNIINEVLINNV